MPYISQTLLIPLTAENNIYFVGDSEPVLCLLGIPGTGLHKASIKFKSQLNVKCKLISFYIPSKFKCQLSFNWQLNLIEICANQSWLLFVLYLLGTADFFGLNFYTSNIVTLRTTPTYKVHFSDDTDVISKKDPSWLG